MFSDRANGQLSTSAPAECFDESLAISVRNVSKCHLVYGTPRDRLKQFLLPRLRRIVRVPPVSYYREFWALKDVSFDVARGETVGIIGRNGAGKSTLLQIICGTVAPTRGTVHTNGRVAALLELGAGFNPDFTGRENVYLNGSLLGLTRKEIDECFDEIAAFADIGSFLDLPVKTYSSGMSVRLAFAVQVAINPEIFIVDEALAVGDEKFQRKCFTRLEKLKGNGCSILFVSHSPASVTELCDRALFLESGERLMYRKAAETVRAYQKLIYAPQENQKLLTDHYRDMDRSGVMSDPQEIILLDNGVARSSDAFDPALVPESTTSYPMQGAEIKSIEILDGDSQRVNVLRPSENYRFLVRGTFHKNFSAVYFGMHIKTTSGIEVTGQRHPRDGDYLEGVKAGDFEVEFGFRMDLLPGVYFVGAGIWTSEEPLCLHRMLDALMFRVLSLGRARSFGYVDASTMEPKVRLS